MVCGCCCGPTPTDQGEKKVQWYNDLVATIKRQEGKTIAITGSTTGTGRVLAESCLKLGARVILLNRPSERAAAALKELQGISENVNSPNVIHVDCDLMDFASVRNGAVEVLKVLGDTGLDVLCNNAGIMALADVATVDGCDQQMQTNHLSHFLLTQLLFPALEKAAELRGEARIVNHSSGARQGKRLQKKYLEKKGGSLDGNGKGCLPFYPGGRWGRYQQTKLANLAFHFGLHDRLVAANKADKIKALLAHPGICYSNLAATCEKDDGLPGMIYFIFSVAKAQQTTEDGTCGIMRGCCDDVKSEEFFGPGSAGDGMVGPARSANLKKDRRRARKEDCDMLWTTSEETTGCTFTIK